jgi:hypothetical protein
MFPNPTTPSELLDHEALQSRQHHQGICPHPSRLGVAGLRPHDLRGTPETPMLTFACRRMPWRLGMSTIRDC